VSNEVVDNMVLAEPIMVTLSRSRSWHLRTQRRLWLEDANPLVLEDSFLDESPEATWRHQAATRAQQWAASEVHMSRTQLEVSSIIEHDGSADLQLDFISRASEAVTIKMTIRKQRDKEVAQEPYIIRSSGPTRTFQSTTAVEITLPRTIKLRREDNGYIADTEGWYSNSKTESITRKKHSARRYKSPCPKDCTTGQRKYITRYRDSVELIRHKTERSAKRKEREDAVRKYVCCEAYLSSGDLSEIEEEVRKLGWWGRMKARWKKLLYRSPKSM
jgi:hypothetical protein